MTLLLIWLAAVGAYFCARAAETRIHKVNYHLLCRAGAEELIPGLMHRYYNMIYFFLPVALLEHFWLRQPVFREMLVIGLALLTFGLALRFWSILSLGPYWTMRCMAVVETDRVRKGPYRIVDNPEYLSRILDGCGLCLLIGGRVTTLAYLIVSILVTMRIMSVETRQLNEFTSKSVGPVQA